MNKWKKGTNERKRAQSILDDCYDDDGDQHVEKGEDEEEDGDDDDLWSSDDNNVEMTTLVI